MTLRRRSLLLGAGAVALGAEPSLRTLIIDGINNHDWPTATRMIRQILEASGRFTVDVSTTPAASGSREEWDRWRPRFDSYSVVINNFNGGHTKDGIRWPAPVEASLEAYLQSGGGLVIFHAANNAFLEWNDYNEMIGLGWRDKSFGPGLIVDTDENAALVPAGDGPQPGHGPRHDFRMTTRDPRHPITQVLPKSWMHPSEQLTHGQHAPAHPRRGAVEKELLILTYALSKDSGRREPMDWVRSWGQGRVYVTMLGHTWRDEPNPNLQCAGFQTLFARGVEWAATGKVTIPAPAKMPTADAIVLSDRG
jgi:uncharacterized protein